jgi:hypothetical protein
MTAPHLALDNQAIEALEKLGFTVGDERAAARIGDVVVAVRRTSDLRQPEFEFTITLPSGAVLRTFARRHDLLAAIEAGS